MKMDLKYSSLLKYFLFLFSFQSMAVGLFLMFFPPDLMRLVGFPLIYENFFKVQSGLFHLILVIIFLLAAVDPIKNKIFVLLSIIVKFTTLSFLLSYYIFVSDYWILIIGSLNELVISGLLMFFYLKVGKQNSDTQSI